MYKERLWLLVRLQIIYEIILHFNGEVSLVKQFNQALSDDRLVHLDKLQQKKQAIIEAVDFYKKLPMPNDTINTFGVRYKSSVNHYLFQVMDGRDTQKYLFGLLPVNAHFGFDKQGEVLNLYSFGEPMVKILPDGKISIQSGTQGEHFVSFIEKLFGHTSMPSLQGFMQLEIASTLDDFMKHEGVV